MRLRNVSCHYWGRRVTQSSAADIKSICLFFALRVDLHKFLIDVLQSIIIGKRAGVQAFTKEKKIAKQVQTQTSFVPNEFPISHNNVVIPVSGKKNIK